MLTASRPLAAAVSLLLLCAAYARTLAGMADQWRTDEDMGHGFFVPVVAIWIVWRERRRWIAAAGQPALWGLAVMLLGAALQSLGQLGVGLFVAAAGFWVSAVGLAAAFGGGPLLRAWALPLTLLLFMLPKLAFLYNQVTLPLQLLASRLAAALLTAMKIAVVREGNLLAAGGRQVAVAEACSGIRYLLPLIFLAIVCAYYSDSRPWTRAALALLAVPVAIAGNAVRVAVSVAVPTFASGARHEWLGLAIYAGSMTALLLALRLMGGRSAHA